MKETVNQARTIYLDKDGHEITAEEYFGRPKTQKPVKDKEDSDAKKTSADSL